jgi:hypothetical protein
MTGFLLDGLYVNVWAHATIVLSVDLLERGYISKEQQKAGNRVNTHIEASAEKDSERERAQ